MSVIDAKTINAIVAPHDGLDLHRVSTPILVRLSSDLDQCIPYATTDGVEAIKRITGRINAVLKSRANGAPATRKDK